MECTNGKISDLSNNYGQTAAFANHTDETEINAFSGLLDLSSIFKSNHEDVEGYLPLDDTG